ncbi:MAG: Crp/Fnr family transcriptional regulator [Muribaculaceae bacterium]|nr:Crp/Fnr family transcriptional regulator [Muribaculaceae bacterium]
MASNSMYESLMELPLFKGISYERLSEIVGNTRLAFLKYLPGERVLSAGDPCTHIKFLLKGSLRLTISNPADRFRVAQTLVAPDVISPDFLFGRHTIYPGTASAIDTVSIMQIEKNALITLLQSDEILLYNYLNILSTNAHKAVDGVLALTTGSLEERIAFWIIALTQIRSTDIVLSARQRDLYTLFGVQRSSLVAALDSLKQRGLIEYTANEIHVLSRRDLRSVLLKSPD